MSVDTFLGLPFNIASYATLCHILASICELNVGELTCSLGDTHIYSNHQDAVYEQICRTATEERVQLRMPEINCLDDLKNLTAKDFELLNYHPQPTIKAPMAA